MRKNWLRGLAIGLCVLIPSLVLSEEPKIQIDHIIWAVPDLDAGAKYFEETSGVKPIVGGVHPGRGTRNMLASAGDNMYFEIIAPDPAQMPLDPVNEPVQFLPVRLTRSTTL